jgi:hypothetical protein
MANDLMRLWATRIEEGQLDIWRKAGRTGDYLNIGGPMTPAQQLSFDRAYAKVAKAGN